MSRSAPLGRVLAHASICKDLSEFEVDALFSLAEERKLPAAAVLFREGALADALLVVTEGRVEVSKQAHTLAVIEPGGVLGELGLFKPGHLRSATATALTPVRLLRMPYPAFQKLLAEGNLPALKVVSNLAHQMADRILSLNEKLLNATSKRGVAQAQGELRRWTT